jgi:2-polyprenyl-3-methyl-5-hydroxy-6-metoxy-1,4-benzoquinol methylase
MSNRSHLNVLDLRSSRYGKAVKLLSIGPKGRLLDVGSGNGAFAALLRELGWEVIGIEKSRADALSTLSKGVQCIMCDVSLPLPIGDGRFDAVFAGEIVEHVVDTDMFIGELWRVLRSQGILLITTPNLASLENRFRLLAGIYPKWMDFSILAGEGHVRYYTLGVLSRQLAQHGFRVDSVDGNFVPILPQSAVDDLRFPLLRLLGSAWPTLSQALIVRAEKVDPNEIGNGGSQRGDTLLRAAH